jgi:hypothetical protein
MMLVNAVSHVASPFHHADDLLIEECESHSQYLGAIEQRED